MNYQYQRLILAVAFLAFAPASYAQVCRETGGGARDPVSANCDMRLHDVKVTCDRDYVLDVRGTRPGCPNRPMPMKQTPLKSYVADYTPYLFSYPRNPEDRPIPYAGTYSIGTQGDAINTFQMFGNTSKKTKRLASCTTQIKVPQDPNTVGDDAKLARLQLDNCTNQYILHSSMYPFQKDRDKEHFARQYSQEDLVNDPLQVISLKTECQPLRTYAETQNEYEPADYLRHAWIKLLQDPLHRKTTPEAFRNIPCTLAGIPCDREPRLPEGLTLENPIPLPADFPESAPLSAISRVQYEEIFDPTHPFSPRWDFTVNDREYSNPTANSIAVTAAGKSQAAAVFALHDTYQSNPENTIFCAGLKDANQETDAEARKDKTVRVDVLEFRREAFEEALMRRTSYNALCRQLGTTTQSQTYSNFAIILGFARTLLYHCYTVWFSYTGFTVNAHFTYIPCWACFGLNGKVERPPCTTNYLGRDREMKARHGGLPVIPGGLNLFSKQAQCNYPGQRKDKKHDMSPVCENLRAPVTMMNKLKMRYHNPDDKDDPNKNNVVFKDGVPEGMTFKEYFDNRMPYPRIWDLGQSFQRTRVQSNVQPPTDTNGQWAAIVGIGREASSKAASDLAPRDALGRSREEIHTDQRCKTQGWGKPLIGVAGLNTVNFGGVSIQVPDPITSWTELKLYQARTRRNTGISCFARYDKVFKQGSAENLMLTVSGAEWQNTLVSKCPKLTNGKLGECEYMTLKEYRRIGSPQADASTAYIFDNRSSLVPGAWRGYLSATEDAQRFPRFGGGAGAGTTGLDNARMGDVIVLPQGASPDPAAPGLPKFAFVTETRLPHSVPECAAKNDCYVKVMEPDNGKFPDVCGNTDTWGEMKTRYYYRPGNLPKEAAAEYTRIDTTSSCEETRITPCEFTNWDTAEIYHISKDSPPPCDKEFAIQCDQ